MCSSDLTHDLSAWKAGRSALGWSLQRTQGVLGRSDNMVKLRGINVYPLALAAILNDRPEFAGEYFCRATRDASGRDELTVVIEVRGDGAENSALAEAFAALLTRRVGVRTGLLELEGRCDAGGAPLVGHPGALRLVVEVEDEGSVDPDEGPDRCERIVDGSVEVRLVEVGEPPEDALEDLLEIEQALERVDRRARLGLGESCRAGHDPRIPTFHTTCSADRGAWDWVHHRRCGHGRP